MLRARSLIPGAILLVATGCSDVSSFEARATSNSIIEGSLGGGVISSLPFPGLSDFDLNQTEDFQSQSYCKEQISSIALKSLVLRIDAPEGGDFNFLSQVQFLIAADGQDRIELAQKDPIEKNQTELRLDILAGDLKTYATAPTMTLSTSATGSTPMEDTTVEAELSFNVEVDASVGCTL